jgi:cell division protein FtsB
MSELARSLRQRDDDVCHLGRHHCTLGRAVWPGNQATRIRLTVESGEATLAAMPRSQPAKDPATTSHEPSAEAAPEPVVIAPNPAAAGALGSLADLPVAGMTRRRIGIVIGALVAAWVILLFARQVGEASEAMARADAMRTSTEQLEGQVSALESELALIQKQAYIIQAAREFRLGRPDEIPFALSDDAPPLPPDAPGSAGVRLGSAADPSTPLDSWAQLLFGDPAPAAAGD